MLLSMVTLYQMNIGCFMSYLIHMVCVCVCVHMHTCRRGSGEFVESKVHTSCHVRVDGDSKGWFTIVIS